MECMETVTRETSVIITPKHGNYNNALGSQLPARSTRLLNRSRLQPESIANNCTEKLRSFESLGNCDITSRASAQFGRASANCSPDDHLFMLDKTLRNSMIQDVYYCKQQLLTLRSLLQDADAMNTFDKTNGNFFDAPNRDIDSTLFNTEYKERDNFSPSLPDDPKYDIVDLRRQVVYLQSQLDDKDRTIRIQQDLINKLEAEMNRANSGQVDHMIVDQGIETVNIATQTDRVRPISMNFDVPNSNTRRDENKSPAECVAANTLLSATSVSSNLSIHCESEENVTKLKNDVVIKKRISTVRTIHSSGNGKNISISIRKSPSHNTTHKSERATTPRPVPILRRLSRNIPTSSAGDKSNSEGIVLPDPQHRDRFQFKEGCQNDILLDSASNENNSKDAVTFENMKNSQIKSIKLLNNLNKLKLKAFSATVSEADV